MVSRNCSSSRAGSRVPYYGAVVVASGRTPRRVTTIIYMVHSRGSSPEAYFPARSCTVCSIHSTDSGARVCFPDGNYTVRSSYSPIAYSSAKLCWTGVSFSPYPSDYAHLPLCPRQRHPKTSYQYVLLALLLSIFLVGIFVVLSYPLRSILHSLTFA